MLSKTLKSFIKKALASTPWVWKFLRWYVRYFPRALIRSGITERVNRFFMETNFHFVARTKFGRWFAGDTQDVIQRGIYLFGIWEPNLTAWFPDCLKRGDVFVDVGANIGYYSAYASTLVGDEGKVVAIEASPTIFGQLASNIELNRIDNIRLLNHAASDRSETVRIYRAPNDNLGASSIYSGQGFEEEAQVLAQPLDQLLTRDEAKRARLIKIDVEGAEVSVVKGLIPLLRAARQELTLVVEVGGGPPGSPSTRDSAVELIALLAREGFNVYRIANEYSLDAYTSTAKPARPQRIWDVKTIVEECDLVFSRVDSPAL